MFVGRATAAADRQLNHDRTYEATIRLGVTNGYRGHHRYRAGNCPRRRERAGIRPRHCRGLQEPSSSFRLVYSAVKIHGQPLYKAARAGRTVERTPREITVYSIEYLGARRGRARTGSGLPGSEGNLHPGLWPKTVPAGRLAVPATLSALRRTRAGVFAPVRSTHHAGTAGGSTERWSARGLDSRYRYGVCPTACTQGGGEGPPGICSATDARPATILRPMADTAYTVRTGLSSVWPGLRAVY